MRTLILHALIFALALQSSRAQDAELKMIPSSAAVVAQLQALETVTSDLKAFVDKVQPGFGDVAAAQLPPLLGRAMSNVTLAGVDQTRDWYVVLFFKENEQPKQVLLIPTTNIAEAKEAMGPTFQYAEKETWLACCKDETSQTEFESCFQGNSESIAKTFDERSASTLMSGHLGIAVNATVLKEVYAEQLGSAEGHLEDLIQGMGRQIKATNPDMDLEYVYDMYRDMGKALLQGVKDSESAVIGVKFAENELQIDKTLNVEADSQTDSFLRSQPVSKMDGLTTLPEGLIGYFGLHGDPEPLIDWSERVMSQMFKDEELKKKTAKSLALIREAKFGSMVVGGDLLPDEEGALRYFGRTEIQPSSIIREAVQQFGSSVEYEVAGITQKQSFDLNAETIDGQSIDIYRMEQTLPPALDPTGMQKAMNEKMYGPEGMVQRIATKEGFILQTMGGGAESMKTLIKADQWSSSLLLDARASLHEQANVVMLVDMPNMVQKLAKLILGTGVVPVPIQPEQLDALEIPPSYAGFSVAAEKRHLTVRARIPAETFQGFVKIGMFVQQLRMQAR